MKKQTRRATKKIEALKKQKIFRKAKKEGKTKPRKR